MNTNSFTQSQVTPRSDTSLFKAVVSPDKPLIETILGPNYVENIIFGFLVLFIFILIIRELTTWYWKINKMVRLLEKIEKNTRPKIKEEQENQSS